MSAASDQKIGKEAEEDAVESGVGTARNEGDRHAKVREGGPVPTTPLVAAVSIAAPLLKIDTARATEICSLDEFHQIDVGDPGDVADCQSVISPADCTPEDPFAD